MLASTGHEAARGQSDSLLHLLSVFTVLEVPRGTESVSTATRPTPAAWLRHRLTPQILKSGIRETYGRLPKITPKLL